MIESRVRKQSAMQVIGCRFETVTCSFLLAGPTIAEVGLPNPASPWLTDKAWVEIVNLSHLKTYSVSELCMRNWACPTL